MAVVGCPPQQLATITMRSTWLAPSSIWVVGGGAWDESRMDHTGMHVGPRRTA